MEYLESSRNQYITKLLLLLLIFIGTGLALSFSISYSYSVLHGRSMGSEGVNVFNLFVKQIVATIIGIGGLLYLLKTPTAVLKRFSNIAVILASIAMIYTAYFGPEINGSRRWIIIMGTSLQTGDFARLALILYLANIFSHYHMIVSQERDVQLIKAGFYKMIIRFMISVFIYVGMLYLQHDYSSLMISMAVIMCFILVSDVPKMFKITSLLCSIVVLIVIVISNPNRLDRVLNYLQPGVDPLGTEFQILQSYELIRQGGLLGGGIGSNMLEVLGLPYFNNDFVFSIIVGEYGLMGALLVLSFFIMMCWYSFQVGRRIYNINRFYYYLLLAATINLLVSAIAHIAVTIGIAPTAGLNLPFYSSGGSAMITAILSYGFILRSAVSLNTHYIRREAPFEHGSVYSHAMPNAEIRMN